MGTTASQVDFLDGFAPVAPASLCWLGDSCYGVDTPPNLLLQMLTCLGNFVAPGTTDGTEDELIRHFLHVLGFPLRVAVLKKYATDAVIQCLFHTSAATLMQLDVSYSNVTDRGLKHLFALQGMKRLRLAQCFAITDSSLEGLHQMPYLESLDLSFCRSITDSSLDHLQPLQHLTDLNLGSCDGITSKGLNKLPLVAPRLKKLSVALLEHVQIGAALSKLSHLVELSAKGTSINDQEASLLLTSTNYEYLDLSYCTNLTDAVWPLFGKMKRLKSLYLNDTNLSVQWLTELDACFELRTLTVPRGPFTPSTPAELKMRYLPGLQKLVIT